MNFNTFASIEEKQLAIMLGKQLDQTEADLDRGIEFSPEFLADYIESALFLSKTYGRRGDRVETAEKLIMQTL